ncbi:hypothetical protein C8Q75DRAFT_721836 [Abortiporus biennis]|nr:hypothetical protein C8Q75DRAFT_721836 [Abortiporus biennis]
MAQPQGPSASRPSTSHNAPHAIKKIGPRFEEARYEDPSFVSLPSNDSNTWYYPSHGYTDLDEDDARYDPAVGNWGRKSSRDAKWMRRGKMTAWGPGVEEWEVEEHARKRLKLMMPPQIDDDAPVILPHLRSPSPPITAPYASPNTQHLSYTSFILDKAVTHSFRSSILDEMEEDTNNLIEGETLVRRALGRLWQLMSEDPDKPSSDTEVVTKQEDEVDGGEAQRIASAPDLTPAAHKLFLDSYSDQDTAPVYDPSQFTHPDMALQNLEKSMATLREIQDDGREYVERLEEIREALGATRTQRNGVWDIVRERAVKELQSAASAYASAT